MSVEICAMLDWLAYQLVVDDKNLINDIQHYLTLFFGEMTFFIIFFC